MLLDAACTEERAGVDREEALMHAGRKRFRPILMTTLALVAIIGGTITSTLLVIPSFYDSIEIWREKVGRLVARLRGKPVPAGEVISAK